MDKNEKLAAKFAEKRPKAAKLEELENKPVKLNTVGVKTDQPKEWLDRFSEKTIDSLHESWAAAGEFKTYGYICRAVEKMKQHGGAEYKVNPSGKREYDRKSPLLQELAQILNFDEKRWSVTRAGLLDKAVQDWSEDLKTATRKRRHKANAVEEAQNWADDKWKDGDGKVVVHALCLVDPTLAFDSEEDSVNTPFGAAAEHGATEIVQVMLEELVIHLEANPETYPDVQKALLEIINVRPKSPGGSTAFLGAAKKLRIGVLQLLLAQCPSLASMDSLSATITQVGKGDIDEAKKDPALDAFQLILESMSGLGDMMDIWEQAVKAPSPKLVKYLIERDDAHITYDQFALIIEKGTAQMLSFVDRKTREAFLNLGPGNLLHRAVKSKNEGTVESILSEFPREIEKRAVDPLTDKTLAQKQASKYPMEHLGEAPSDKKTLVTYMKIRNLLLDAMIKSDNPSFGIGGIRFILSKSKVEANTICLHLSTINTEERGFSEYVDGLTNPNSIAIKRFKFEKILKYANFPDLDDQPPSFASHTLADLHIEHNEIRKVFEWLKKQGVQEVLELTVNDRLLSPHSDDDIAYCVGEFAVRALKWRKLDLYLPAFNTNRNPQANLGQEGTGISKSGVYEHLRELHLYSSGNQSVLDQWYGELEKFKKLRRLQVYIVKAVLSETRAKNVKSQVEKKLDEINERLGFPWTKHLGNDAHVPVSYYPWTKEAPTTIYRKLDEITNDVVGSNLAAFIGKYKGEMASDPPGYKSTKVALIDSGIVLVGAKEEGRVIEAPQPERENAQATTKTQLPKTQGDLLERVVDGTAFVNTKENEEPVWWHASDAHGTQMARLICSIDPCCELYVAKVAETRGREIPANNVADAINWAIKKDVDVISLSLVTYLDPKLNEAIKAAAEKGIVIITSTADEGVKAPPSAMDNPNLKRALLKIAACNRWGKLLEYSQNDGYDYGFIGHNVHIGQVPFLKSEETISGSSVATAIAAGAASLTLACCRIAKHPQEQPGGQWRPNNVGSVFNRMSKQKFAMLENFCGDGKKLTTADFTGTVKSCFGDF